MSWRFVVRFDVPGIPRPGGSKRGFVLPNSRRVVIVDAGGSKVREWRSTVRMAAKEAMFDVKRTPSFSPIRLTVVFKIQRPKCHYGTGRNAEVLKASAPRWSTSKPDRTKLLRSTEDALVGVCWKDDSQVVTGSIEKTYSPNPGASIQIEEWVEDGTLL
jgi:Holliday junction resolvase RusA-like endonuclease